MVTYTHIKPIYEHKKSNNETYRCSKYEMKLSSDSNASDGIVFQSSIALAKKEKEFLNLLVRACIGDNLYSWLCRVCLVCMLRIYWLGHILPILWVCSKYINLCLTHFLRWASDSNLVSSSISDGELRLLYLLKVSLTATLWTFSSLYMSFRVEGSHTIPFLLYGTLFLMRTVGRRQAS